jgi:hypothetical protein
MLDATLLVDSCPLDVGHGGGAVPLPFAILKLPRFFCHPLRSAIGQNGSSQLVPQ